MVTRTEVLPLIAALMIYIAAAYTQFTPRRSSKAHLHLVREHLKVLRHAIGHEDWTLANERAWRLEDAAKSLHKRHDNKLTEVLLADATLLVRYIAGRERALIDMVVITIEKDCNNLGRAR